MRHALTLTLTLALAGAAGAWMAARGGALDADTTGALPAGRSRAAPFHLTAPPPASPAELAPVIARVRRSVVRVLAIQPQLEAAEQGAAVPPRRRAQVASGVVIDGQGHLVTTARAIAGCIAIRVRTADGRELAGHLLGLDPLTDLALVRIPAGCVAPLPLAPESAVQVGARVITVAESYGKLPRESVGQITWRYHEPRASLIQMSNVIYPGNSGGAVADERGRLVGVIIGGLGEVQGADSLAARASARGSAFAVPIDDLVPLVDEMRRYGGVRRGFLGVSIQQGLIDDPEHPGAPAMIGVRVSDVLSGGPAWRAGLRPGDLVVAVGGVEVNSPDELMRRVTSLRPGATADLLWLRGDREFRARVELGSTPDSVIASTLESATRPAGARREDIEAEIQRLERELKSPVRP